MMNITNQELNKLGMPQVIIEDEEYDSKAFGLNHEDAVKEINRATLKSMYKVQNEVYKLFGMCDMREIEANTISPATQNLFMSLKSWNINLGGCFATVSIRQRVFDGCYAEISIL